jgi:hypothetical protein
MELIKKIKIALDETRMLILGAQILLGFQFRGVFDNGYDQLPSHLRYLGGIALLPMICVVALLIAPGPYHRIVEDGEDSKSFHRLVTVIINLALLPFAIALGLDVVVTTARIFGEKPGAAAGIAVAAVAIAFWYGLPHLRKRHNPEQERLMRFRDTEKPSSTPLDVKNRANAHRSACHSAGCAGVVRVPARNCVHTVVRAACDGIHARACDKPSFGRACRGAADGSGRIP